MNFSHCVGLAAGFDKQAEAINEIFKSGLSFLEVGGITPKAQPGNPSPRMFRLTEDRAIINRFGLNSEGHAVIVPRLQKAFLQQQRERRGLIGVNLADNKGTADPVNDYILGIQNCGPYCDFMVLNISCPNQVGTTALQQEDRLREMLGRVENEESVSKVDQGGTEQASAASSSSREAVAGFASRRARYPFNLVEQSVKRTLTDTADCTTGVGV